VSGTAEGRDDRPTPFPELRGPLDPSSELGWLRRAEALGVDIAPMAVVPARVEHDFYRWNNLPSRLDALFAAVDPNDPDDDDLEDLAPTADAWIRGHALLDEVVDAFYAALVGLPGQLVVRRPGADGRRAPRGRPALLALKRIWADDWGRDQLAGRSGAGWVPTPRPVLVHAADLRLDPSLAAAAGRAIDRAVEAWCDADGRLARLTVPTPQR
jgi:hypothetical protein